MKTSYTTEFCSSCNNVSIASVHSLLLNCDILLICDILSKNYFFTQWEEGYSVTWCYWFFWDRVEKRIEKKVNQSLYTESRVARSLGFKWPAIWMINYDQNYQHKSKICKSTNAKPVYISLYLKRSDCQECLNLHYCKNALISFSKVRFFLTPWRHTPWRHIHTRMIVKVVIIVSWMWPAANAIQFKLGRYDTTYFVSPHALFWSQL